MVVEISREFRDFKIREPLEARSAWNVTSNRLRRCKIEGLVKCDKQGEKPDGQG